MFLINIRHSGCYTLYLLFCWWGPLKGFYCMYLLDMVDGLVCLLLTVPCILGLSAHLPDGAAHDAKVRHDYAVNCQRSLRMIGVTQRVLNNFWWAVLGIRIRMFLGLPDPDPLVWCTDPDPDRLLGSFFPMPSARCRLWVHCCTSYDVRLS